MEKKRNVSIDTVAKEIPQHTKFKMERRFKRDLAVSFLCPAVRCVSLFFVPLVNFNGEPAQAIGAYIIALIFWGCILAEVLSACRCRRTQKAMERRVFKYKPLNHALPGAIAFFKNREAMAADILLFTSTMFLAVIRWLQVKTGWVILIGISFLFLSFNLHYLLNGRNYRYYKAYKRQRGVNKP